MACRLRQHGFEPDDIWALLVTYGKAEPPFSDEEVAYVVNGACLDVECRDEVGSRTPEKNSVPELTGGGCKPRRSSPHPRPIKQGADRRPSGSVPPNQQAATQEVIPPYLTPHRRDEPLRLLQMVLVVAPSKSFKTWFIAQLVGAFCTPP